MTPYFDDTITQIEDVQLDIMRKMPAETKIELVFKLSDSAKRLARTGLELRYPNASEGELNRRMASLLIGEELANKVFGPFYRGK